jgi:hypothetical protein
VELVKCIALLHNIITDVENLHDSSSNHCSSLDANNGTQLKNSEYVTVLPLLPKNLFFIYFNSPDGSAPWQEEANGDEQ